MEIKQLCITCRKNQIYIKKRGICALCYARLRRDQIKEGTWQTTIKLQKDLSLPTIHKYENQAEISFVQNYFTHKNWTYHPCTFRLDGTNYSPDFYDGERNVFIEVSGTRQAYHFNKKKYELFRKTFPKINFEIRKSSGELLNEYSRKIWD